MLAKLKLGAAYIVVENTYSPDRIEFIKKDCGCSLVLDESLFLEMMCADFLGGYENTDPHDVALVIYTSGTTGNPKGAVHEYGQLDLLCISHIYQDFPLMGGYADFAVLSPMNFAATQMVLLNVLLYGSTGYIIPYHIVKNIGKLKSFVVVHGITHLFITPSLLRVLGSLPNCVKSVLVRTIPIKYGIYHRL